MVWDMEILFRSDFMYRIVFWFGNFEYEPVTNFKECYLFSGRTSYVMTWPQVKILDRFWKHKSVSYDGSI